MALSRTLRITLVADLAALAVLLNLLIDIPAPYAPFLKYEIWEIPIVVGFIAAGFYTGLLVGIINALVLEFVKSSIPSGPWFNLAAILSMVVGIYVAERIAVSSLDSKGITFLTAFGSATRVALMTFVNLALLPLPYPIGFNIPFSATIALLPVIGFFNLTVALYTVPLSCLVVKAIQRYTRFPIRKVNIKHS